MQDADVANSASSDAAPVAIDPQVFRDHCLVLGSEGCGKTTLASKLFRTLVEQGTAVIAIDTTGDLSDALAREHGLTLERGLGSSSTDAAFRIVSVDLALAKQLFHRVSGISDELRLEENANLIAALQVLLGFRPRRFSPEFSLLENLVNICQQRGSGPDLSDLPELVRNPPLSRIGAFPLDSVISADRRDAFASAIRGLLETPSLAYSSATPGLHVAGFLRPDSGARCTVLSFADRSPRIRRFLLAVLGSKLRTFLASSINHPFLIWIDEAPDFLPRDSTSPVSRMLLRALERWDRYDTSFALVAQQLADLHEDVDEYCGTMLVGQTFASRARHELVDALDLVNPPIDEEKLDADIKSLRPGQFILRSQRLETLQHVEVRR